MNIKNINNFTIEEFETFKEISRLEDTQSLLELFGVDINTSSLADVEMAKSAISNQQIKPASFKLFYLINGTVYRPAISNFTAGQFIDFQNFKSTDNLAGQIACFFIPTIFGFKRKWGSYSLDKVIADIKKLRMSEVIGLINFFMILYTRRLKTINNYLKQKEMKEKMKFLKLQEQKHLTRDLIG